MDEILETGISDNGIKYSVYYHEMSNDLVKLLDVYSIDRRKAKIIYEHRKSNTFFNVKRVVLFEYPNGDFRMVKFLKTYGVSKSNIIYSREREEEVLGYTNNKIYFLNNKRYHNLTVGACYYMAIDNHIKDYLNNKFGWLRNLYENPTCHSLSLNTVIKNKLYNVKACLRYIYKVPYPIASMLEDNIGTYTRYDFLKVWKEMKKCLINVENLKESLFKDPLFKDTTIMANTLGYKVNCSWSNKRLKIEHDKMGKEIVDVILEFEELRDLKINPIFTKFAEFSGFHLFLTNHDLIEEGKLMHHCVGTYSSQVDRGDCAIYKVYGCTLELRLINYGNIQNGEIKKKLHINQLMEFDNKVANFEIRAKVSKVVNDFNSEYFNVLEELNLIYDTDELPF